MGLSRHKVSYKCDCGVDYGDCGAKCAFIFVHNRTVDVYHIFHVDTHNYRGNSEEKPKIEQVICFGDSALKALKELLESSESTEEFTKLELETCKP